MPMTPQELDNAFSGLEQTLASGNNLPTVAGARAVAVFRQALANTSHHDPLRQFQRKCADVCRRAGSNGEALYQLKKEAEKESFFGLTEQDVLDFIREQIRCCEDARHPERRGVSLSGEPLDRGKELEHEYPGERYREGYFEERIERRGRISEHDPQYEAWRQHQERDADAQRAREPQREQNVALVTQARFLDGFIPPDYIVDGVLQRRFFYSLTGVTGGGKTAIALVLARAIGSLDPHATFGKHRVEKGRVVYFVGENPEDVRARLIGTNSQRQDDPTTDQIYYIAGVFDIEKIRARLISQIEQIGGVDLVIVDTSAAYFLKDDENNNPQMGAHARVLRSLATVPGGPCVLALCHPIKHASDRSHLLPRGGGAFLAEIDGNLTAWRYNDDLVEFHHGYKFRGPGFEPITFRIEKITTPKLIDSKGRQIPTIHVVPIFEAEEEAEAGSVRQEEDRLLGELLSNPNRSLSDLARACGFMLANGEPHKSKAQRRLGGLVDDRLVKNKRGRWVLTEEGRAAAERLKQATVDEIAEERGGKVGTNVEFFAAIGKRLAATVPCIHCGKADGNVHKVKDGRLAKSVGHAEALHATCARAWFAGESTQEG